MWALLVACELSTIFCDLYAIFKTKFLFCSPQFRYQNDRRLNDNHLLAVHIPQFPGLCIHGLIKTSFQLPHWPLTCMFICWTVLHGFRPISCRILQAAPIKNYLSLIVFVFPLIKNCLDDKYQDHMIPKGSECNQYWNRRHRHLDDGTPMFQIIKYKEFLVLVVAEMDEKPGGKKLRSKFERWWCTN